MAMKRPPRIGRALLAMLLPHATREGVLQDLDELWLDRLLEAGATRARLWYWGQVVRAVGPCVAHRWQGESSARTSVRREREGGMMIETVKQDVAFALKQLRRHPGIGFIVVTTLALGIGATTAIFSVVHSVLLTPLPYENPSELVMITSEMGGSPDIKYVSGPDIMDLVDEVDAVQDVAIFSETTIGPMTEVDRPEHVKTTWVTWSAFDLLGVQAALGRTFVAEDGEPVVQNPNDPNPPPIPARAAVISHAMWQRSFGGDPAVLGRVVHIWGGPSVIVGVLPEDLRVITPPELNLGADVDVWNVSRWDPRNSSREQRSDRVIARLRGGTSVASAQREVDAFAQRLRERYPLHAEEETRLRVTSVEKAVAGPVRGPLVLLMGAVSLVLLIACVNVANLLLARGTTRASEMAVRASLGADRRRIVRQLLTENAVLALMGALAGMGLAAAGVRVLHAIRPATLSRLVDVRLDLPVLAFTVGVAIVATLISGTLPALHGARMGITSRLATRGSTAAAKRSRTGLVVAEVALSVMLLVGAALLIRTFSELQRMPLGFDPERLLTVNVTQSSRPREERQAFEAGVLQAVNDVPGVAAAGIVFPLPMNGVYDRSAEYAMDGRETEPTAWTVSYFRTVNPTYFEAMGLELIRGRHFTSGDEVIEAPVVIVDERMAQREWGNEDPVGHRLFVRGMEGDTLNAEVIGVVEYSPQWDHRDTRPTMYFPRVQYQSHEVSVVVRVAGDLDRVGPALLRAIKRVDPGFPSELGSMKAHVSESLAASRFLLVLMEVFAGLALLLSAVGLYGVLSYTVRQQTRELGVRLAFGATAGSVIGRVVKSGAQLAAAGIGIGLVGALLLGRSLEAQLFRVSANDPWALGATAVVVLVVSVLASLIPARRASRIDPMVALRED